MQGKEKDCRAKLVCETNNPHDRNAVAVLISSKKVGHLSRTDAKDYRSELLHSVGSLRVAYVYAMIVGGWIDDDSEGHFGVRIDLGKL